MRSIGHRLIAVLSGAAVAAAVLVVHSQPAAAGVLVDPPPGAVPNRYLVTLATDSSQVDSVAAGLTARHGGTVRVTWQHALHGFSVEASAEQAAALATDPAVRRVEPDAVVTATDTQPNPPSWGLDRIDQRTRPLNASYTYQTTAATVTAFVIDTGILTTHPEFEGRASAGFDAFGGTGQDCNGHGTHVAGTIGARSYGVAKAVRLVGVRVLDCGGSGTFEGVISGVNWVTGRTTRPAVANMSLSGPLNQTLNNAVTNSINAGIHYAVAASNNSGDDACRYSPASVPAALTVAASTITDTRPTFTNQGVCVDLFAPGENITSTWLNNGTNVLSGTSMASPHVAGACALFLAFTPGGDCHTAVVNTSTPNVISNPGSAPNRLLYTLGFAPPTSSPRGRLDLVERFGAARGWASDPDAPSEAIRVDFYVDGPAGTGTFAGSTTADLPYPGQGNHGFAFVLPQRWLDGNRHTLYAYGIDRVGGNPPALLPGSPLDFVAHRPRTEVDFNGDKVTEVSVWRPSDGTWYITPSGGAPWYTFAWGLAGDQPLAGDFDGDGRTDYTVFRPSDQTWYIMASSAGWLQYNFGLATDVPVPADYTGDGKTDVAVWRPSDGTWYILPSEGGSFYGISFGQNGDRPVPGDYDGDGRTDAAVFRPATGQWFLQGSTAGLSIRHWGLGTDRLVPADYDRDGKTDLAVWRESDTTWYLQYSLTGRTAAQQWGSPGDVLVPGDYDGTDSADPASYRPGNGQWWVLDSTGPHLHATFGANRDIPVPGANLTSR